MQLAALILLTRGAAAQLPPSLPPSLPPLAPSPPSAPPDSCASMLGRNNSRALSPPLFCYGLLDEPTCRSHYSLIKRSGAVSVVSMCHWVPDALGVMGCTKGTELDLSDCTSCADLAGRADTRLLSADQGTTCNSLNATSAAECEGHFMSMDDSDVRLCHWVGHCAGSKKLAGCSPSPPPSAPPLSPPVAPSANVYLSGVEGVGSFGGTCTCPDGLSYLVGDNSDSCGSLACVGGRPSACESVYRPERKGMKAICSTDCFPGRYYLNNATPPGSGQVPPIWCDGLTAAGPATCALGYILHRGYDVDDDGYSACVWDASAADPGRRCTAGPKYGCGAGPALSPSLPPSLPPSPPPCREYVMTEQTAMGDHNHITLTGTAESPVTVDDCKHHCCIADTLGDPDFPPGTPCLSFDWDRREDPAIQGAGVFGKCHLSKIGPYSDPRHVLTTGGGLNMNLYATGAPFAALPRVGATMSPRDFNSYCTAEKCIDGDTTTAIICNHASTTTCHSPTTVSNPALEVDLGAQYAIGLVDIHNRKYCCAERLGLWELWVGNVAGSPATKCANGDASDAPARVSARGR